MSAETSHRPGDEPKNSHGRDEGCCSKWKLSVDLMSNIQEKSNERWKGEYENLRSASGNSTLAYSIGIVVLGSKRGEVRRLVMRIMATLKQITLHDVYWCVFEHQISTTHHASVDESDRVPIARTTNLRRPPNSSAIAILARLVTRRWSNFLT